MAWIRVESSVARNRKFIKAGPAASWLWVCGLGYCQEGLTDGFIPADALDYLGVQKAGRLATMLVLAGLWEACEGGGWRVHDYLEHNYSASEIRRIKQERQQAGAHGGKASWVGRRKQHAEANAEANHKQTLKQLPNPSTSTSTSTSTASTTDAVPRARPQTLVQRRRLDAAFEFGRLYVPQRVHADFVALRNNPNAEAELSAFYERICEDWTTGSHKADNPDPDLIKFWKARYAEEWRPTSQAGKSSYAGWKPNPVAS